MEAGVVPLFVFQRVGQMQSDKSTFNIPNAICVVRMLGSLTLLVIAIAGLRWLFIATYFVLIVSDLVDGPLARWLKQKSALGALLDSVADAFLNFCLIVGASILCWEILRHEFIWISVAIVLYVVGIGIAFSKFGRLPAYHTWAAKTTQWLAAIAAVSLILDWSVWPLRVAAIGATLTNLETIAITMTLKQWRTDVLSLYSLWCGKEL